MDSLLLSDLERYYIIQGSELGCRTDGRAANEYRPLEVETGILSHASGSASVRISETHLMGCVKVEVGKPLATQPDQGRIEIHVECYPTATSASTDRGANEIADNLKMTLQAAYRSELLDLQQLCIQPGRQCWIVHIDLLILEGGGNFLDAASIVIKASLLDATRYLTAKQSDIELKRNLKNTMPFFDEKLLPLFVTVHKTNRSPLFPAVRFEVGNSHIVDASKEEEACSLSRLSVVVYPDGSLGSLISEGCGSCQLESLIAMSELARTVGIEMNEVLTRTLKLERQLRC
ncbi:Exosome complex exonuclease RRP42 [Paragonimus heterotremus]|uniref:Ribosomal RNA-processing protein 42 n=1 Tax=Paragonimus heterotremus TaxID=100268 RepID=A0A8J4WE75_9TREM|nr:Exosome complex exonuclease RRP42 [Paragonimus heterotremus]